MRESIDERRVIVNADDFGLTDGINRGILEAHQTGIVTSSSLMVRYPAARQAAELAQTNPKLSVGLHFDIAEWRFRDGSWEVFYEVVDAKNAAAVEVELQRQLALFQHLLGRAPTHLDSHQHLHKSEPAREILLQASEKLRVPLRACHSLVRHRGDFYGQTAEGLPFPGGISTARLSEIIRSVESGWTEIGCHPGYTNGLDSVYLIEREIELRVLCSAEIWRVLEEKKIELLSFRDFAQRRSRASSSQAGDA
ncbi:MAG: ChbG/HpnK family deacetylase [Verrucomicrobiota bacterium]|nr:ChbG/HpnK family deacetylase [Verrucomicrobiota bacterium]MDQ6938846.1 ChbG/HpnK family deacetylase [Verrucomicrobiota bacterium]